MCRENVKYLLTFVLVVVCCNTMDAQPLTGYWKGKVIAAQGLVKRQWQLELQIIREGDSLKGLATYTQGNEKKQVPVSGYANPANGTITWWDDASLAPNLPGLSFEVDFNCPGEGIMKLEGTATEQANQSKQWKVMLDKQEDRDTDEVWASISKPAAEPRQVSQKPEQNGLSRAPASRTPVPSVKESAEEMYAKRSRTLVSEIPISGDSLVIHFFDHAEIDGDSISLFMNQQLLHQHILLKASPFTLRLAVKDLGDVNELTMVAENLGSIPPNTSLMIAWIDGVRHEARLESTERTSAMIRFVKPAGAKRLP